MKNNFILAAQKEYVELIRWLQLQTVHCETASKEGILLLFISIGDLHVGVWFGIVENFALNMLLETLFID